MSEDGALLQTYNQELVKYIEHLKKQKDNISKSLDADEVEREKVIKEIDQLNTRLRDIDYRIAKKLQMRQGIEKTLTESTSGVKKILESSQIILNAIKKEVENMDQNQT